MKLLKRFAAGIVLLIIIVFLLDTLLYVCFLFQGLFYILFGWIWGVCKFIVGLVNEPVAIGFGVLAFLLLPIAIHFFVAQIAKRRKKQWTLKKSFVASLLIVLIAGAGIATVGGIHEIIWLFGSKEPIVKVWHNRHWSYRLASSNHLRQLCLGFHVYLDQDEHLPSGGTILDDGQLGHGWITQILPYLEQTALYQRIDLSKPWNDPVNAPIFQERIQSGLASYHLRELPEAEQKDRDGFAKTDYAANQFVFSVGKSLRVEDMTDGFSHTIFIGEAVQNLQPWGSPINSRDPRLGINKSPLGFGSKHIGGINFVLGDGATIFLNKNTDPKILKALATPNGGEPESKEVVK
ncbi:MAG: DUF1559 domain-containing protein [Planctomycetaceae bacterium]|jgi:hypothetical protein|nr:DUF1559 domain-containing protein [Planctomycetaceae bacterium]